MDIIEYNGKKYKREDATNICDGCVFLTEKAINDSNCLIADDNNEDKPDCGGIVDGKIFKLVEE